MNKPMLNINKMRYDSCERCQGSGVIERRIPGTYHWQRRTYTIDCPHCGGGGGCKTIIITANAPEQEAAE